MTDGFISLSLFLLNFYISYSFFKFFWYLYLYIKFISEHRFDREFRSLTFEQKKILLLIKRNINKSTYKIVKEVFINSNLYTK